MLVLFDFLLGFSGFGVEFEKASEIFKTTMFVFKDELIFVPKHGNNNFLKHELIIVAMFGKDNSSRAAQ